MQYEDETERLERIRKAWQPLYDKQNYTLTLEDALEIDSSIKGLIKMLRWEENRESEEQQ